MIVEAVMYMLPDGRSEVVTANVSDDLRDKYDEIRNCGLRITVEKLRSGMVSLTLEDEELGDYNIQVCSESQNIKVLEELIRNFDASGLQEWREDLSYDDRSF